MLADHFGFEEFTILIDTDPSSEQPTGANIKVCACVLKCMLMGGGYLEKHLLCLIDTDPSSEQPTGANMKVCASWGREGGRGAEGRRGKGGAAGVVGWGGLSFSPGSVIDTDPSSEQPTGANIKVCACTRLGGGWGEGGRNGAGGGQGGSSGGEGGEGGSMSPGILIDTDPSSQQTQTSRCVRLGGGGERHTFRALQLGISTSFHTHALFPSTQQRGHTFSCSAARIFHVCLLLAADADAHCVLC
jgi:hypothetical protein